MDEPDIRAPDQNFTDRLIDNDEIIDRINSEPNVDIRNIMIASYEEDIRHRKAQNMIDQSIIEYKGKLQFRKKKLKRI